MRSLVTLSAAALVVLGLTACTGKPENSPQIKKKFQEYDSVAANVNDMSASMKALSSDVRLLSEQLSELRAMAPDGAGASEAVRRLESLEARLSSVEKNGTVSPTSIASGPSVPPPASSLGPVAGPLPANDTVGGLAAPPAAVETAKAPETKEVKVAGAKTPKVAAKTEPAKKDVAKKDAPKANHNAALSPKAAKKATGSSANTPAAATYYKVQAGDTVESVAARHGITAKALLDANKLPAGAKLPSGGTIRIPKK